jgi:ATP-binding cassette subfamily B protein
MKQSSLRDTTHSLAEMATNGRWALATAWGICPKVLTWVAAISIVRALLPAALALTARGLVNAAIGAIASGDGSARSIFPWLTLGFGLTLLEGLSNLANKLFKTRLRNEVEVELTSTVLAQASRLEVGYFEDPESQDRLARAQHQPSERVASFVTESTDTIGSALNVASLVSVLAYIEPLTILVVAVFSIPYLFFQLRLANSRYQLDVARTTKRRWSDYFVSTLTGRETVSEIKILNLAGMLTERFRSLMREFRDQDQKLYRKSFRSGALFISLTTSAIYALFFHVGIQVVRGNLTLGDLAIFGGAAMRLRNGLASLIGSAGQLKDDVLHLHDVRGFLEESPVDEAAHEPSLPTATRSEIAFDNVSFSYPGSSEKALDKVSFKIAAGETVAIVGENGAGKSTLLKLVARLYDPDSGAILFDGLNLRNVDRKSIFQQISFVFQTFTRFEATAGENIAYGDCETLLGNPEGIRGVASQAGIDAIIEGLPQGYETRLGRRFGEADLSGGNWQKLAVARAFSRKSSLLILDEPTSNLDARAEFELFSRFRELAHGRTAILVSHRFSTVKMADRILVLHDGKIVESGSHDQLMAERGTYAQLYELQQRQGRR